MIIGRNPVKKKQNPSNPRAMKRGNKGNHFQKRSPTCSCLENATGGGGTTDESGLGNLERGRGGSQEPSPEEVKPGCLVSQGTAGRGKTRSTVIPHLGLEE